MNPSLEQSEMPFILVNSMGKTEPNKQKLIRKYVMLGKNKGKVQSRPRRATAPDVLRSCDNNRAGSSYISAITHTPQIPARVGSDYSSMRFAAPVEPELMHSILRLALVANDVAYPLGSHISFHKDKADTAWFNLMLYDAAYMHAIAFSSQTYFFLASGREDMAARHRAIIHEGSAIKLLRERFSLQNDDSKLSDATLLVVLCFVRHAQMLDDYDSVKKHMNGLSQIINIRGGLSAFIHNPKLIIELLRYDITLALHDSTTPKFIIEYSTFRKFAYEEPGFDNFRQSSNLAILDIDEALGLVWKVMSKFCSAINSSTRRKGTLPVGALLNAMISVIYPVLNMDSFDSTSLNEAARLGLLAFSAHAMIGWKGLKMPLHANFEQAYRRCLISLDVQVTPTPFLMWLLTIGRIIIFTPADDIWLMPWMRVNCNLSGVHCWSDLYDYLKEILWIDVIFNQPGRAVFDTVDSSLNYDA